MINGSALSKTLLVLRLSLLSQYACCHMGPLIIRIVENINEFLTASLMEMYLLPLCRPHWQSPIRTNVHAENQGPRSNSCGGRGWDRQTDGNVGNINEYSETYCLGEYSFWGAI